MANAPDTFFSRRPIRPSQSVSRRRIPDDKRFHCPVKYAASSFVVLTRFSIVCPIVPSLAASLPRSTGMVNFIISRIVNPSFDLLGNVPQRARSSDEKDAGRAASAFAPSLKARGYCVIGVVRMGTLASMPSRGDFSTACWLVSGVTYRGNYATNAVECMRCETSISAAKKATKKEHWCARLPSAAGLQAGGSVPPVAGPERAFCLRHLFFQRPELPLQGFDLVP